MTAAAALPLAAGLLIAVSALLTVSGRRLAFRIDPRLGAWVLTTVAATVAFSSVWMLTLLAASLVDDTPIAAIRERLPVNDGLGAAALVLLLATVASVANNATHQLHLRRRLRLVQGPPGSALVVVPDSRARAFAAPGRPHRVVITQGMLNALNSPQRRVLLSHEHAHLTSRHPVALGIVQLAAAANPLLIPLRGAVGYLCERYADEAAATEVDDRLLVAEAIAAAARAESHDEPQALAAFHRLGIAQRLTALLGPRQAYHWVGMALVIAAAVIAFGAATDATADMILMVRAALNP
jgi:Zn-dependent protease with chaperone function